MSDRFPKNPPRDPNPPYKRIATEEAWIPKNILDLYIREIADKKIHDPGFHQLWGFFAGDSDLATRHRRRIQDLDEIRIGDMDASGIDMQVLALGSPGVQLFDPATASSLTPWTALASGGIGTPGSTSMPRGEPSCSEPRQYAAPS